MKTFYSMEGTFDFLAACYACGMGTEMFWKDPGFTWEGRYHTNPTTIYISARSLSLPVSVSSDGANSWCGMSLLRAGRWDTNEEDQDYEVSHVDVVSI